MRARSREITRVDESRSTPKWCCYCRFGDAADFPGQKNTGMGRELYSVERKGETGGREGKVRSEGKNVVSSDTPRVITAGNHGPKRGSIGVKSDGPSPENAAIGGHAGGCTLRVLVD